MKFLTNTFDPSHPNAKHAVSTRDHETPHEAWQRHQKWLEGKVIGEPQATKAYTVPELKAFNMVGVYVDEATP